MKKPCKTCGKEKVASQTKFSEFSYRKDRKRYYNDCKACRNAKGSKTTTKQTREQEAIEGDPFGFLDAAIIEQAIIDWRQGEDDELLAFFASEWFEELCSMANSDPEYLRKHILE